MTYKLPDIEEDDFEEICLQLELGKPLNKICEERKIGYSTVTANIARRADFQDRYARARETQADYLADAALAVYDGDPKLKYDQFGNASIDPAWVQMQKNKAEQMKWHAGKMRPKVYGDSTTVKGDKENPLFSFADALSGAQAALQQHRQSKVMIEDKHITIEGDNVLDSDTPIWVYDTTKSLLLTFEQKTPTKRGGGSGVCRPLGVRTSLYKANQTRTPFGIIQTVFKK